MDDRFHLFQNLREAFERLLSRHSKQIEDASEPLLCGAQEPGPAVSNLLESVQDVKPAKPLSFASNQPLELQAFAQGLKCDSEAVSAAITTKWSDGQTEGQVNRLKMLKRQMYGRAGFDLLRLRYLVAA